MMITLICHLIIGVIALIILMCDHWVDRQDINSADVAGMVLIAITPFVNILLVIIFLIRFIFILVFSPNARRNGVILKGRK
jgi:DNA polymerase sigma